MNSDLKLHRRSLLGAAICLPAAAGFAQGVPGGLPAAPQERGANPVPPAFGDKSFDGARGVIRYTEGPDLGPTIVFIPGMGVPRQSYFSAASRLARDFHVIVLDQLGQGESSWASDGKYRVIDYGADLLMFIRANLAGRKTIISGHSLGGLVALRMASEHPDIVSGLNAEDNPFLMSERGYWESHWIKPQFEALLSRLEAYQSSGRQLRILQEHFADEAMMLPRQDVPYLQRARAIGKHLSILSRRGALPAPNDEQSRLDDACSRWLAGVRLRNSDFLPQSILAKAPLPSATMDPRVVRAAVTAEVNDGFDHRTAMAAVRCPTLYWNSDEDLVGVLSQAEHDEIVALVSRKCRTRHVVASNVGHLIHAEDPEMYARELRGFFLHRCAI